MNKHISLTVLIIILVGFAGLAVKGGLESTHNLQKVNIKLESKTTELKQLELDFKKLNQDLETESQKKDLNNERIKQLEEEKQKLEQRYKALEVSKANEKAEQQRLSAATSKIANVVAPKASASGNCGDNVYKQYIYKKESTCNITAVNSIGCVGIGQSCPGGSGLKADCPDWKTNFDCQDRHFTKYAVDRYGSWELAYYAWLRQGWW